jgi:2-isopropylmalate synthase
VGDLVYTSFSGSHQDAIKKAFAARKEGDIWDMPYLPIDPKDVGRSYEAVIRVNSQSGKGGMAYLLESEYGIEMPRRLQMEFMQTVQRVMDVAGKELTAADLWELFVREYGIETAQSLQHRVIEEEGEGATASVVLRGDLPWDGETRAIEGRGNGPIDAFTQALSKATGHTVRVMDYHQHAIGAGADAKAVAYLELRVDEAQTLFGVGIDANVISASLKAIVSGVQRARGRGAHSAQSAVEVA